MPAHDPVTGLDVRLELDRHFSGAVGRSGGVCGHESADQARSLRQQGDVVLEADGVERYRWNQGKLFFATVIGEKELAAREEWVFALDDILTVEPGTYFLLATVTAQPAPPPVRGEVSVLSPA